MNIQDLSVAILATHGFEQSELEKPLNALKEAGVKVDVISPEKDKIKGWSDKNWGKDVSVDIILDEATPEDYDLLVLPGGVMNPDTLRMNDKAIAFIKHFVTNKKPIAAICHGPWTLINANGVKGLTLTSYPSIKVDLINAGATWVDREVVVDKQIITSRNPDDLPAFIDKIMQLLTQTAQKKKTEVGSDAK